MHSRTQAANQRDYISCNTVTQFFRSIVFHFLVQQLHQTKRSCLCCHSRCSTESHLSNIADSQTSAKLAYNSSTNAAPVENNCFRGWMPGCSTLQSVFQQRVGTEGKYGITLAKEGSLLGQVLAEVCMMCSL